MACFHPVEAWLDSFPDGRQKLRFNQSQCVNPLSRRMFIPCGQCIFCRIYKAVEWTVRMSHERSLHSSACFVTLTYNEESVPRTQDGLMTLPAYQDHAQLWLKRMRKKFGKFRYYLVGEYGSESARPHYHAILFGLDMPDRRHFRWTGDHWIDVSAHLQSTWPYGYTSVEDANNHTIGYVAKYCMKKITGKKKDEWYKGRLPEDTHMSLKPGIGADWISRFNSDVYKVDLAADMVYQDFVRFQGRTQRPPKYYDKWLADHLSDVSSLVIQARRDYASSQPDPDFAELARKEEFWKYRARQNLMRKSILDSSNIL